MSAQTHEREHFYRDLQFMHARIQDSEPDAAYAWTRLLCRRLRAANLLTNETGYLE